MADREFFKIIIIDDKPSIHEDFKRILNEFNEPQPLKKSADELFGKDPNEIEHYPNFEIHSAYQGEEGVEKVYQAILDKNPFSMAYVDMRIPPGIDGLKTLSQIWKVDANIQTVMCTAYTDYLWSEIMFILGDSSRLLILKKPVVAIEITQMTLALTKKWAIAHQMRIQIACAKSKFEKFEKEMGMGVGYGTELQNKIFSPLSKMNLLIGQLLDTELSDTQRESATAILSKMKSIGLA